MDKPTTGSPTHRAKPGWTPLAVIAAFALGVTSAHIDRAFHRPEPVIRESPFGFLTLANDDYRHCQTDMTLSEHWSDRLMRLNGVWTAACVVETDRRRAQDTPQEGEEQ